MKRLIFLLSLIMICAIVNAQAIRPQPRPIDPAKITPGWHTDTSTIQINYKTMRYDPKGHVITKYFMTPARKPINMTLLLVDSTFKAVKPEDVSDVKN